MLFFKCLESESQNSRRKTYQKQKEMKQDLTQERNKIKIIIEMKVNYNAPK